MSNAWDQAANLADKHANQGGMFVKLANDGDKVVGVFVGDPHAREVVWTGEGYEPYDENSAAHKGKRASLKVALNFFDVAEGGMRVFELNNTTFRDLVRLRDKYGLDRWVFEIERQGAKGDPRTRYSILPEHEIGADLAAAIRAADLHDLASMGSEGAETPSDGPVAEAEAERFAAALRRLPRSAVDTVLNELKVRRIRDVRASEAQRARELLARLERQHAPAAAQEVDPFA